MVTSDAIEQALNWFMVKHGIPSWQKPIVRLKPLAEIQKIHPKAKAASRPLLVASPIHGRFETAEILLPKELTETQVLHGLFHELTHWLDDFKGPNLKRGLLSKLKYAWHDVTKIDEKARVDLDEYVKVSRIA